jgi:hypothetical protein
MFGNNDLINMHGFGTSHAPHCRIQGLYNPKTSQFSVRAFAADSRGKEGLLVRALRVKEGLRAEQPSHVEVFGVSRAAVEERLNE